MRLESKILLYSHVLLMMYLIYFFSDLLFMMVFPISDDKDLVLDRDINKYITAHQDENKDDIKNLIPKHIHQTYKTDEIPEQWIQAQKQCIDLHYPDYNYTLWTDYMVHSFLEEKYAWFLPTYDAYEHNIQRADALRYFVLREYGGIYIDLDDVCERKLDPLLQYPAFFRKTSPLGVSNDVMGTVPNHPLFVEFTENLERFSKINILNIPYITIMFSTGPMFVSVVYQRWIRKSWAYGLGLNKKTLEIVNQFRPRVMQPYQYKNSIGSFFSIAEGSSWHTDDSNIMFILGAHITACVVGGFIFFFVIFYSELLVYTLLQGVIRNYNNQDANDLDTMNINKQGRFPFQLKIARIINKTKALFGISYTNLTEDLLPSHKTSEQTSTQSDLPNQTCNTNTFPGQSNLSSPVPSANKYNYQRHQMRRQSNLPREIQTQLQKSSSS